MLDFWSNHILEDIFFHKFGNIVMIQKIKIINQDILVKIDLSNHIKRVVAFNNSENIIIETESDAIIIYGLALLSCNDEPRIIGKSGKTQGARTVNIPAKNEINNIVILGYLVFKILGAVKKCLWNNLFTAPNT